jgi:hypothetical protein
MASLRITFISLLLTTLSLSAQPKQAPPNPNNPFVRIAFSTDIPWLEKIARSPGSALDFNAGGGLAGHARDVSTAAYARLGALGIPESLAAVKRVEDSARADQNLTPEFVPIGITVHPAWHFSDSEVRPIAQVVGANGTTYGIVVGYWMGDLDFFLISSTTPTDLSTWTRPKLIPNRFYRGFRDPKLTMRGVDELVLSFTQDSPPPRALMEGTHDRGPKPKVLGSRQFKLSIANLERDSDKDGWTDIEESRLGLDPGNADSDADGLPDGRDVCPNSSAKQLDPNDEDLQVLQRAVFATFGLSRARSLLLVGANSRRLTIWGYQGPIIYGEDVKSWTSRHQYGAIFVNWRIQSRSEKETIVEVVDYEGPLAAGGQHVRLRKFGNEWFVVGRQTTWVS